jgi:hypothetical protein
MRNKKIKTKFSKYSEILPKELYLDWKSFSLDPSALYIWNALHDIMKYLPDGVELPSMDSDFDPNYEDPQKLEYMRINTCWRLRMWWVLIERWEMYSLKDLSIELQKEMSKEEPEARRNVAALKLWEGIFLYLDNHNLPYLNGADAWKYMQLEDKKSNFFSETNIEDYKEELRSIIKYLGCSQSLNVNPLDKKTFPIQHKMLRLAHFISTENSDIRDEFRCSYLNPYVRSVRHVLKCLRNGIYLPRETELTTYRHKKISGGIEYFFVDGRPVEVFRRRSRKNFRSGRGRKSKNQYNPY